MADNPHGKGFGLHLDHGKVHVNLTSVWVDDAIRVETEETLAAKRWYHLTVTYDGSKVARQRPHLYRRQARQDESLDGHSVPAVSQCRQKLH